MARSIRHHRFPPDLAWWLRDGPDYGNRSLEIGGPDGLRVAYVTRRACGDGWTSWIRWHLDWPNSRWRVASSQEQAMKWAEWWAIPRIDELREAARARAERLRGNWGVTYPGEGASTGR